MFTEKDCEQIFLAAVSNARWATLCQALGLRDDLRYATHTERVQHRATSGLYLAGGWGWAATIVITFCFASRLAFV